MAQTIEVPGMPIMDMADRFYRDIAESANIELTQAQLSSMKRHMGQTVRRITEEIEFWTNKRIWIKEAK